MPEWSALFLHGAGGGGWEWRIWTEVWRAHGVTVRAPDLRPVAAGIEATELRDYQAQADETLASLPRPRVLVGASLGGLLAMRAAARADALILINPLPPAPWHAQLRTREWPARVPWRRDARLASTRAAMPLGDAASALHAFRHWRDESGAVLAQAYAGVECAAPRCPVLIQVSARDEDVPPALSRLLARAWDAETWDVQGGHVDPLLGRAAADCARLAVEWLNRRGPPT